MGLFGGGNSKSTTINEDNRSIVDYSNANLSSDTDIDNSINGTYAGNSGNITVVDGGAIDLANNVVSEMGFAAAGVVDAAEGITDGALDYGGRVFSDAIGFADNASERNLEAALAVTDAAEMQVLAGNDLAMHLSGLTADAAAETNKQLINGYDGILQFAESYSRSDGAALAENNTKVVAVIAVALVAGVYFMRGKK